jgi:catechol 2,3-dioxygenase-like lactoylglutathione lyase family enzyme
MSDEKAIPMFSCAAPDETLAFYEALGFETTHRQVKPYVYLAVKRGKLDLHFYGGKGASKLAVGSCLVMVSEVESHHGAFAAGLKEKFGRVPTAGLPRISRLKEGQKRFTVVDPCGNSFTFIARDEPDYEYPDGEAWSKRSPMERALETAANFRDMRGMDASAAKALDVALARNPNAAPIERARALAARAELAAAMGDAERARSTRAELALISLSEEERERYRDEFQAADAIALQG